MDTDKDKDIILNASDFLLLESLYNATTEKWEVSTQDSLIGIYDTQEEAAQVAVAVHIAFETGYVNGLLLGYQDKAKAKEALQDRGIHFNKHMTFED